MRNLRQFIIKHFWGLYRMQIPWLFFRPLEIRKRWTSAVRPSRIIFPTYLICGILIILQGYGGLGTWISILATPVFFWLGFNWKYSYFRLFPPTWDELDREQRWDYGWAAINTPKCPWELTADQWYEWHLIDNYFKQKLSDTLK
ncbi:hypothetical protein PBT90_16795 [Algoriphagus halophytocola]|uniref:hypothetical protein n=1 Tax=Algoriphagus halophytocola TaxID=2991499 RepID=UPI0022DDF27E|nr:hypothetical protein [Algoriphagus sp. TR-M9]WBL42396.1 hypothetical protein PBT90_16795 [Algoriphagus sp. TR-M9]